MRDTSRNQINIGFSQALKLARSHPGKESRRPDFIERVVKINCHHAELFAYFVRRLKETPDGDGSLPDHSAILYGGAISDGNSHSHHNLPLILAGHAGGVRGGRHLSHDKVPVTNLFLTLLEGFGVRAESIGDSTQRLTL